MSERYSKSFKIAYCGIVSALSVVIMLAALIPSMTLLYDSAGNRSGSVLPVFLRILSPNKRFDGKSKT